MKSFKEHTYSYYNLQEQSIPPPEDIVDPLVSGQENLAGDTTPGYSIRWNERTGKFERVDDTDAVDKMLQAIVHGALWTNRLSPIHGALLSLMNLTGQQDKLRQDALRRARHYSETGRHDYSVPGVIMR